MLSWLKSTPETEEKLAASQKMLFLTGECNGFGDLIFAKRFCEEVRRELSVDIDIAAKNFKRVKAKFEILQLPQPCKNYQDIQANEYKLVVIGPGVDYLPYFQDKFDKDQTTVIVASEYDYVGYSEDVMNQLTKEGYKPILVSSGFGGDGILIDTISSTPADLAKLGDTALKEKLFRDKPIEDYSKTHSLSLAYCSHVLGAALVPVIHGHYSKFAAEEQPDLVFIAEKMDSLNLKEDLKPLLKEFDQIEIHGEDKPEILTGSGKGVFRIFCKKSISFQDMQILQAYTKGKFTTITGDQSLGEVIAKDSPFFYLLAMYKKQLLLQMALFADEYVKSKKLSDAMDCFSPSFRLGPHETAKAIYDAREDFSTFCKLVREKANLGKKVCTLIKELLQSAAKAPMVKETKEGESVPIPKKT